MEYTMTIETYDNRLVAETKISKIDFYYIIDEWENTMLDSILTKDKLIFGDYKVEIWTFVHDNTIIHLRHYID